MSQLLTELWLYPPLLLLVWILSQYLRLPQETQPMALLQLFATRLGNKVNPPNRSTGQQQLSGALALLTLVLPLLSLLSLLYWFSDWPLVLDALLLFFCLDFGRQQHRHRQIASAIQRKQLGLARDLLQLEVLRDCSTLSEAGVCKASIEHQALQLARHWLALGFWFLVGGGLTAVAYRLILLCNQSWNSKQPSFQQFGKAAATLGQLCSLPGYFGASLLYAVLVSMGRSWRELQHSKQSNLCRGQRWVLASLAGVLQVNLAGPVKYQGQKQRRDRLGPSRLPQAADVWLTVRLNQQAQLTCYLLLLSVSLLQLFSILY
ncbi:cobalamin biosynthesis protein [Rheinheimera sp.]|uniref:cobalamin biosynthesis protein CobD/CbiB n=1 Tax=Rheinheimera sp. TaxID=1869214 RepID=UPI00307FBAB7